MSEVKVNKISPRTNCGTVQLGDSGDTITIPAGATITNNGTQTGFGRTGTVDWDTTAKTASFTAVSGNGYFVNTTSGAITVTLPAGSAGDIVGISDYASTFQTNNVTITPNGTDKINGVNDDATLSTQGLAVSLVYVDSTRGWKSVTGSDNDTTGVSAAFVTATGGTITCCGDYKIHTFTGPGTFTVTCAGNEAGSNSVDYLVVAGGGSGGDAGDRGSGGGGAGGYRESSGAASGCYSASPLGACVSALPVTAQGYPVTVGAGGAPSAAPNQGCNGSNSIFSSITSTGGGGGGGEPDGVTPSLVNGLPGGSGGGGGSYGGPAGTGNTPPVSPAQGQNGGPGGGPAGPENAGGGGGGASAAGDAGVSSVAGNGGNGATTSISGTPTAYGGGGGGAQGGSCGISGGTGGTGGGGGGGGRPSPNATAGTANTGGGGGADSNNNGGAAGGSGIVIIRYKYQ